MKTARAMSVALMLALAAQNVGGQTRDPLPPRVNLAQVLQLLDERSPRTAAERAALDVAMADRITANTLPNPSVSYGGLHLLSGANVNGVAQHQVVLDQPMLLFGQRQVRREVADLSVTTERARVATALAERRLIVRQAFAMLLARQEELRVVDETRSDLRRIADVVAGRADAGDRSQYDVLRIGTELRLLDVDLRNAQTSVEDASGALAVAMGFPDWRPRAEGSLEPGTISTEFVTLWERAQTQRPSLVAGRRRLALAQGGVRLAQRERLSVPALSGGTLLTRGDSSVSAYFGVSVPLPLFDRNRGAIARATAQERAETLLVTAETAEAQAEVERTRAALAGRREALGSLDRDLMPTLPRLRQMAEDAYREGQGDILELLDATRSLRNIQRLRIQQLELVKLAEEEVIAAAGLDAQPIPE